MRYCLGIGACGLLLALAAFAAEPAPPKKTGAVAAPKSPGAQAIATASPQARGVNVGPNIPSGGNAAPVAKLTDDSLAELLGKLGYETKVATYENNGVERKYFTVACKNYWVGVMLDNGDDDVLLFATLAAVPEPENVPTQRWLELLRAGDNFFGHFVYVPPTDNSGGRIKAIKGFANVNVDLAFFKQKIDNFDFYIVNNKDAWNEDNFR
ncbi:MAG: hypothetical protein SFU86_20175 [Pirellulaceae bacterium]|nr:hypothetical protein [Pirellulaceae bacterium]